MESLIDQITCNIHKKKSISLDNSSFQIICTKCCQEGKGKENLIFNKLNQPAAQVEEKQCYKHLLEEALFYCDDCAEFICKTCFATDHRQHNCSTPDLIVKTIKDSLKKTSSELNSLKKNVEDNITSMQELNNFFTHQKTNFKNNLQEINDRIIKNLNLKAKEFSEEIENIFNGIDFEVESSTQRLESTKKKATKMLTEFQNFYKEVEAIKSDKRVCIYKKTKDSVLNENKKFLSDLQFFLNENLEKTKNKSIQEMENFSRKCTKFQKNAEIYENSVINTITSGIPNICMRVRRFKRFFFSNARYFKTNSICMLTSQTINLVGFSVCGLFNNKNQDKELNLEIKIYEMDSVTKFDPNSNTICNLEIKIPIIQNVIDPVYQFYLKSAVTINKDKVYYIFMNNLSGNNYIDIWTGEVSKDKDDSSENQHSVLCNNSNVKFNFINAFGVESDFNEFTGGILSDIIFSHID
jgi:hypothetical protein